MPEKIIYTDGSDEFFIDESGALNVRNDEDEDGARTLLLTHELEGFIGWLTDEVDAYKAKKAEQAKEDI